MANDTATHKFWKKLPDNKLGHALFSLGMVARVPYFGSIVPTVERMEPGLCEVTAPNWFGVHNHIGTFHAIAACNLAEVAMGMLCEATVPTTHRWIPKSMTVDYTAKADASLRAVAKLDEVPDFATITEGQDLTIPITVTKPDGKEVVRARITVWVSPAG